MKGRISLRHLLFAAVAVLVFSVVGYADPVLIFIPAPGVNTFVFQNVSDTLTATDFEVTVSTSFGLGIERGFGGAPFPVTTLQGPLVGGGFVRVVYDGGPGIPRGGTYTHSFPDWPVGTLFSVTFSSIIDGQRVLFDPRVLEVNRSAGQGFTTPTPEPTTLFLLGTGVVGVVIKTRKRFKRRKSGQTTR